MRLPTLALASLPFLLAACGGGPEPLEPLTGDRESAVLMRRDLVLGWRGCNGSEEPGEAEILLEGFLVGKGEEGLAALRRLVRSMAKESRIRVQAPPADEPAPPCPFDRALRDYCGRFGITLVLPDGR